MFRFEILAQSSKSAARVGRIHTEHGIIETPAFLPVGTQGAVKAVTVSELREVGAQIVLSNTYHLFLRPGGEVIRKLGGLHRFMAWDGPILTDSGGFQVFSLTKIRKLTPEGVTFQSHVDGSWQTLTPEKVVELQEAFQADIFMPLDVCPPYPASAHELKEAVQLTTDWFKKSQKHFAERDNRWGALFGIVQGGTDGELRRRSCQEIAATHPEGFGIGGLSVGEPKELLWKTLDVVSAELPREKPKHLLGVGYARDIEEAVKYGIDTFDTVIPTRLARHGSFLTNNSFGTVRNMDFTADDRPIDPECDCRCCRTCSRAYIRHLFFAKEIAAFTFLTIHNLRFLLRTMENIRQRIRSGKL